MSSPPSVSSWIVNGGTIDAFNILNAVTFNSISPVGMFKFLLERSMTVPFTCITNSRPNGCASSCVCNSSPINS